MKDSDFMPSVEGVTASGQKVDQFSAPEMDAKEFSEHLSARVATSLELTKLFEVVEVKAGIGQIHIMGRVKREDERRWASGVVLPLLTEMESNDDCTGFVGKQYLLKQGDGMDRLKYAWVISFSSSDLQASATELCTSFEGAIPKMEVTEGILMGQASPQSGGRSSGRKGATPLR